mgnify:CR=1 FL=1
MRAILLILIVTSIISCDQPSPVEHDIEEVTEAPIIIQTSDELDPSDSIVKEYPLIRDTLIIGKQKFIVFQSDPRSDSVVNLTITNSLNEIIYVHDYRASNGFEFEDFDGDGFLDIRLYQITNIGGISELIMFDKAKSKFRTIENFDNFPQPEKIENTAYWYSYHRSGCSGANWGSELFKIENFNAIQLGRIDGYGCEDSQRPGMVIYKNNKSTEIELAYIKKEDTYYPYERDIIKEYWNENYKLFNNFNSITYRSESNSLAFIELTLLPNSQFYLKMEIFSGMEDDEESTFVESRGSWSNTKTGFKLTFNPSSKIDIKSVFINGFQKLKPYKYIDSKTVEVNPYFGFLPIYNVLCSIGD